MFKKFLVYLKAMDNFALMVLCLLLSSCGSGYHDNPNLTLATPISSAPIGWNTNPQPESFNITIELESQIMIGDTLNGKVSVAEIKEIESFIIKSSDPTAVKVVQANCIILNGKSCDFSLTALKLSTNPIIITVEAKNNNYQEISVQLNVIPKRSYLSISFLDDYFSAVSVESSITARVSLIGSEGVESFHVAIASTNSNAATVDKDLCILSASQAFCDITVSTIGLSNQKIYIIASVDKFFMTTQSLGFIITEVPVLLQSLAIQSLHKVETWGKPLNNINYAMVFSPIPNDVYDVISCYEIYSDSDAFAGKTISRPKPQRDFLGRIILNFKQYTDASPGVYGGINEGKKIQIWAVTVYNERILVLDGRAPG